MNYVTGKKDHRCVTHITLSVAGVNQKKHQSMYLFRNLSILDIRSCSSELQDKKQKQKQFLVISNDFEKNIDKRISFEKVETSISTYNKLLTMER